MNDADKIKEISERIAAGLVPQNIMDEAENILQQEIARELMLEINPDLTEEKFQSVWKHCLGNGFNGGIMYKLLELKNERN